jgi:hypothetical protein
VTTFFDLQTERDALHRDREAIMQALDRPTARSVGVGARSDPVRSRRARILAAAVKELIGKQAELRTLKYRYADAHPAGGSGSPRTLRPLEQENIPRSRAR